MPEAPPGALAALRALFTGRRVENPVRAYHGSPHRFDQFDMNKIGTGEGNQAYGHGLYFAEAEPTAETYLGPNAGWRYGRSKAQTIYDQLNDVARERNLDNQGWSNLNAQRGFWEKVVLGRAPRAIIADAHNNPDQYGPEELRYIQSLDPNRFKRTGANMYEVNLHVDPNRLLDWDRPLREQPGPVQSAFNFRPPTITDSDIAAAAERSAAEAEWLRAQRHAMETRAPMRPAETIDLSIPAVTQNLREQGIPGIRYLDQGSRQAGQGTSNYVIFDPSVIEILRRYGITGPIAGATVMDQLRQSAPQGEMVD